MWANLLNQSMIVRITVFPIEEGNPVMKCETMVSWVLVVGEVITGVLVWATCFGHT